MGKVQVILNSGRTTQQGIGLEVGKTSQQYFESTSYAELHPNDAMALGVGEGQPVKIETQYGSVIVYVKLVKGLDPGMVFLPYGPWANQLFDISTEGTGMPAYKGVPATVEPAGEESVLSLDELVNRLRGEF